MAKSAELEFATLPPIFILPVNLPEAQMHEAEDSVLKAGGHLSYDPQEARIFLGRVSQKKRAAFELRSRAVWTEDSMLPAEPPKKKRRTQQSSISGSNTGGRFDTESNSSGDSLTSLQSLTNHIVVLKIDWLRKSLEKKVLLPHQPYLVYTGRIVQSQAAEASATTISGTNVTYIDATYGSDKQDSEKDPTTQSQLPEESGLRTFLDKTEAEAKAKDEQLATMKYSPRRFRDQKYGNRIHVAASHPSLKRTTTSEHDLLNTNPSSLPPLPAWMLEPHPRANYACLRSTFMNPPNAAFIQHLDKIKEARILTLDEIGVRAYSTSIASIAAYPHVITSPAEIKRLPGCDGKAATLWIEWYTSALPEAPDEQRHLEVTDRLDEDDDLKHLKLFYAIWGVGADTARKFYFEYGWKDLDDVVEFGWDSGQLNRVQQIGVKFYDEFNGKIPRKEVEDIADVVLEHARLARGLPRQWWSNEKNDYRGNWRKVDDGHGDETWDPRDMVCVIVGGYRKGKEMCGDVDLILSHRNEEYTKDLVVDVVKRLEDAGHITHTLTLHTTNSDRDQHTLPYKAAGHSGHGFDTLDKALCVWQDPIYDREVHTKNPNIHRRVDIIVSPWKTVGAAVLGWSAGTTFERDIRLWCKKEKGWKFDSSGVRDRGNGAVLDFESASIVNYGKRKWDDESDDGDGWEDRERRLMEGLGIGWRPARERCTG